MGAHVCAKAKGKPGRPATEINWDKMVPMFFESRPRTLREYAEAGGLSFPSRGTAGTALSGIGNRLFSTILRRFRGLVDTLKAAAAFAGVLLMCAFFLRSWDETKMVLTISGAAADDDVTKGPVQIMVLLMACALVVRIPRPNHPGEYVPVIILTWLPTRMMPVAQQTATFFDAAVGKLCDVFLAVLQGWPNLSVGNILDRAAANFLKVKFDEYRSRHAQVPDAGQRVSHCILGCKAHDNHHNHAEAFSTLPRVMPRLAKAMGSMAFAGVVRALRKIIGELVAARLRVVPVATTNEAHRRFREAAIEIWFTDARDKPGMGRRAFNLRFVRHYLNGNWESRDIVHFCPPGCCTSRDQAKLAIIKYLPKVVLPYHAARMAQHRWIRPSYEGRSLGCHLLCRSHFVFLPAHLSLRSGSVLWHQPYC